MDFASGQHVLWRYKPHVRQGQTYLVAAEVVHTGSLRVRIRIKTTGGGILLRWVKPKNLRAKQSDERGSAYPTR